MSPRHHLRHYEAFSSRKDDEYRIDYEERKYLNEVAANALNNAVSFVSPIQRSPTGTVYNVNDAYLAYQRRESKSPENLPAPADENSEPYLPYRSSKPKRPS